MIILKKDIDIIIKKATNFLLESKRHLTNDETGWHQHLGSNKIGVVATSMAITYIYLYTSHKKYKLMDSFKFILNNQREDGGWAYISNISDQSNTEATCWALRALHTNFELYSTHIKKGIAWLIASKPIDKDRDSGWGFIDSNYSRVYNTCFVIRTLNQLTSNHKQQIESAKRWLLNARHDKNAWGETFKSTPTLFHTSYVISTLIELGLDKNDLIILNAINWINNQLSNMDFTSIPVICNLEFIEENSNSSRTRTPFFHYTLPHIIKAYIDAGQIDNKYVLKGLNRLLELNKEGFWNHPFIENTTYKPIWAIYDSVNTLNSFKQEYSKWDKIYGFIDINNKTYPVKQWNLLILWFKLSPICKYIIKLTLVIFIVYSMFFRNFNLYQQIKIYFPAMGDLITSIVTTFITSLFFNTPKIWKYFKNKIFNKKLLN